MNSQLKIQKDPIGGWPAVGLSNSLISLSAVPSIGGRVMELRLAETNVLYGNPRHWGKQVESSSGSTDIGMWRNYGGSKVWPAPQGWNSDLEWPGPPDPVLDSGVYQCQAESQDGKAWISLESAHDDYSGVTLARTLEIEPGTSIVRLHHRMRNTSRRPVRWGIWEVTQVNAARGLDVFVPTTAYRQVLGNEPYEAFDSRSGLLHLRYDNRVAKFVVEPSQGWIACLDRNKGVVLVETFPITPGADYFDGAPISFWISGKGTFTIHGDCIEMSGGLNGCDPHVETEVMGPLTSLEPGESCELRTTWRLAAINTQEIISVSDCGTVGRKLAVDGGRVTGSFGVFYVADLELLAFDHTSQIVGRFALGRVSPLHPVVVDENISLPSHAVRCSLMLFDQQKKRLGILDHVQIR